MYIFKQPNVWYLITILLHYPINATDSQTNSHTRSDRSSSHDFDWESMIDWSYSPGKDIEGSPVKHNTERSKSEHSNRLPIEATASSISPVSKQAKVAKTKKKGKSFKERYSAEI